MIYDERNKKFLTEIWCGMCNYYSSLAPGCKKCPFYDDDDMCYDAEGTDDSYPKFAEFISGLKLPQKPENDERDDFVTLRVPKSVTAPGWGLKFQRPVFPHVDIPKQDCMDSYAVKPLGELIGRKLDEEMTAFGNEHGFPVIFVFYQEKTETNGGIVKCTGTTQLFTKDQMREAAEFASQHEGELGVFDPKEK